MDEQFEIDGVSVVISTLPTAFPRKRPAFTRPDEDDLEATAEWKTKPVPTPTRTVAEFLALWFGNTCGLCQQPIDMVLRHPHPGCANVDHIEPRSSGGLNVWGNVRLTHRACNMQRGNLTLPEPSEELYVILFTEATTKFLNPESFKPSVIWVAREVAASLVASRAMLLAMVASDVDRGVDDGFTDKTRAAIALADARVKKSLAQVVAIQATH